MIPPHARDALPPDTLADPRADDRRRAAVTRMTVGLAHEMLEALRRSGAVLPVGKDAEIADRVAAHLAIVDRALKRRLGDRADLSAAMDRRRLQGDVRHALAGDPAEGDVLDRLARAPEMADAVAAYRRRESARLDPFGDPVVTLDELGSAGAAPLGWTIAAAVATAHGDDESDDDLLGSVASILDQLSGHDPVADAAAALVRTASANGRDRAALAIMAMEDGWLALGAAALGDLVGLDGEAVLGIVLESDPRSVAAIARAALAADRGQAASLLLAVARVRHGDDEDAGDAAAEMLDRYDAIDPANAGRLVADLRAPSAYRDATAAFGLDPR